MIGSIQKQEENGVMGSEELGKEKNASEVTIHSSILYFINRRNKINSNKQ